MEGFESPLSVLILGSVTFLGLRRLGMLALANFKNVRESLFFGPASLSIGLFIHCLLLSILAIGHFVGFGILIGWWLSLLMLGAIGLRKDRHSMEFSKWDGLAKGAAILLLFVWLLNLLAAAAPSSKVDEVYYHILLPKCFSCKCTTICYVQPSVN